MAAFLDRVARARGFLCVVLAGWGVAISVSPSRADTFTWDGGGADSYWQTAANWSGDTAPGSDGSATLAFAGNARSAATNDFAADTVFAGISLTNNKTNNLSAFILSGNRLVLGGNLTTTASSPGTLSDAISLGLLLNAARTVTVNLAHNLTISGVIGETGGSQSLTKMGTGELTLTGANTYSGKTSIMGTGRVYFNSISNIGAVASAFGAPATAENGVIDVNARITYTGGAATSDRVFNYLGGYQFDQNGSGTLTLTGGFTGSGAPVFRGSGTFVVDGLIALGGGVGRTDGGTVYLNNPTNTFTGALTVMDGTISVTNIADAGTPSSIGAGSSIVIGQNNGTTGRFRYAGSDDASCNRAITVVSKTGSSNGGIIENATAGTTLALRGNVSVDSAVNAPTLQLTGAGNGVLSGVLNGAMRVTVNGSGVWTLAGANTYTGVTTVSSGMLRVNGSTAAGSAVTVASGAALAGTGTVYGAVSVAAGGRLIPGADGVGTLAFANAGASALTLNGNTVTCEVSSVVGICDSVTVAGTLVLNGANTLSLVFADGSVPPGTYTLMTYAGKSGSGSLSLDRVYPNVTLDVGETAAVLTVSGIGSAVALTWVGDGTANAWDTTSANWSPLTYADSFPVIFDDTGSASPAIAIADAVAPFSISVSASSKNYIFSGAGITGACDLVKSGSATLTLSNANAYSGLTAVNAGTLALDGALSNSCVSVAWGATLTQGALGRIDGGAVSVTNYGTATFNGTNGYGGTTVVGVLGISNITLNVNSPFALGSTAGGTVVNGGSVYTESRLLIGNGVTVTGETLTLNPSSGYRAGLRFNSGGTGTWDGDVVIANVGGPAYIGNDNSSGTFVIGGSDADTISGTSGNLSFRGNGTVVVNSRISLGSLGINRDDAGMLLINSTGNTWGTMNAVQGTLKLGVSEALPASSSLYIGKASTVNNTAAVDLNGTCQQVARLGELHQAGSTGTQRLLSAAPATLVVSNDTANTFGTAGSCIEGAVSLVKTGSGALTLTGTNTTSGSFVVSNGTLVVSATGTLGNSTNVVVAAGTLTLQGSEAVTNSATVWIADGGAQMNLAAGVNEVVKYLYFGGRQKRAATYGATGSGAAVINDAHFAGTGILTVLRGSDGLLIQVR